MQESSVPFELEAMSGALNYRRTILNIFDPYLGGDILEVGGGVGFFSESLASRAATKSLCVIEPDPASRKHIDKRCGNADVRGGTAADLPEGDRFDSIVSINVLEHIEDDLAELKIYREHLTPAGFFCLFVPARMELFAPIDADFGHHRRYDKKSLRRLLEAAGYNIVKLHYFNFAGYVLWFINFVLFRQKTFSLRKVRLNDRFVFPITRFVEQIVGAPLIGQSLIVIAQRSCDHKTQ